MKAPAGEHSPSPIAFGNGKDARLAEGCAEDFEDSENAASLIAQLDAKLAKPGRPVIVVCGGADNLVDAALERADAMIGVGVAQAAETTDAAVVDGGTSAGVMLLTGQARARRPETLRTLVGVAPKGKVSYPGEPQQSAPEQPGRPEPQKRVPLEENHSHFILADSDEWGGETSLMMAVAKALADGGPVVMIVAGGGPVTRSEAQEAVRRNWPIFVLAGTGGLADTLSRLWMLHREPRHRRISRLVPHRFRRPQPPASAITEPGLREIVLNGDIRRVAGDVEPGEFARRLSWELQDEPILKDAWQRFATYDGLAVRLRRAFTWFQAAILVLGVVGTLLALINSRVKLPWLHWAVVVVPILVSVLVAVASRRAVGQRWVMLRAAAESIKGEIYRYRTSSSTWAKDQGRLATARHHLAEQLNVIEKRLTQTDASSGPLTSYRGPLPPRMFGAGGDDDGLSPLRAERYLSIRVGDQLVYFDNRIRALNRRRNLLQSLAIASGAAGAILAAAKQEIWIGLTAGASAAALAYLSSLQVDNTIVTYNQTASRLMALERGWRAPRSRQQAETAFRRLVDDCEAALATELTGWVQQMNESLAELRERQASEIERIEDQGDAKNLDNVKDQARTARSLRHAQAHGDHGASDAS